MPIVYYGGPEGACKTMMMTRDSWYHYRCGGTVYAFPGYELLNTKGEVVSKMIMPHQVMDLINSDEYGYIIDIDEIQNFLNKHKWYEDIVDLLTYGVAAQRRKRSIGILATGPIFGWVPKDLRDMFHLVVHLEDYHWKNKSIPRGVQAKIVREDRRGVLSGEIGRRTRPRLFNVKRYWRHANTYSIVDPKYQFSRVRIKRSTVTIDDNGNIIPESDKEASSVFEQYSKQLQPRSINDKSVIVPKVFRVLAELADKNVHSMALAELGDIIREATGIQMKDAIIAREYLTPLNCQRINNRNERAIYSLPRISN